jgi:N-acyl homoserine lactone hydrolase
MIKLYAFTCGTVTGEFAHLMEGGEGDITVPIPVFLIEHAKGRALFDTGLHPDCQHDPAGRLGARLAGLFRIGFQPGEEVSARLKAIDRDRGEIDLIINSHFHFDHVGGNALIPNATMLVQRREWDAGMDTDTAARRGFNPRDFDLGHKLRLLDGEHDVFGDGSVVCLPTHGHTPGHQSLRLRFDSGEVVLAADARYFLPNAARAQPSTQYVRPRGDASLARSAGGAGKLRCTHLLWSRPGVLAVRAASACCHRMKFPRAILFDLDDTILVAFGPAQSQWQRTIAAFADRLGPIEATVIAAAIQAASNELWADPARHVS